MNPTKRQKNKKGLNETVNLIPMINLIFLLLIFFLLTGVISKKDNYTIEKPISKFGEESKNLNEIVILTINSKNQVYYEDNLISLSDLNQIINSKEKKYIFEIDKNAKSYEFVKAIEEINKQNIKKIFLRVEKSEEKND